MFLGSNIHVGAISNAFGGVGEGPSFILSNDNFSGSGGNSSSVSTTPFTQRFTAQADLGTPVASITGEKLRVVANSVSPAWSFKQWAWHSDTITSNFLREFDYNWTPSSGGTRDLQLLDLQVTTTQAVYRISRIVDLLDLPSNEDEYRVYKDTVLIANADALGDTSGKLFIRRTDGLNVEIGYDTTVLHTFSDTTWITGGVLVGAGNHDSAGTGIYEFDNMVSTDGGVNSRIDI
jgi:hypothetical protein